MCDGACVDSPAVDATICQEWARKKLIICCDYRDLCRCSTRQLLRAMIQEVLNREARERQLGIIVLFDVVEILDDLKKSRRLNVKACFLGPTDFRHKCEG